MIHTTGAVKVSTSSNSKTTNENLKLLLNSDRSERNKNCL